MVHLPLDPFLNELTSMFEETTKKGSIWVNLKRSSMKSKVQRNKMNTAGVPLEYKCLVRAIDGKKKIATVKINHKQVVDVFHMNLSSRTCIPLRIGSHGQELQKSSHSLYRITHRFIPPICSVSAEREGVIVSSQSEDITIITSTKTAKELKVSVKVSGAKTESFFDDVFSKMVAAAQPIPGFRRVKGGKTPDIPRDILLEVLGPSKVYKQVIKKVINSTIAEYVKKEGIKVGTDLRVEQSIEELEPMFEPGEEFTYDAIIQLAETN